MKEMRSPYTGEVVKTMDCGSKPNLPEVLQEAAIRAYLTGEQREKTDAAERYGIGAVDYAAFKLAYRKAYGEQAVSNERAQTVIDTMTGYTERQKAALFQTVAGTSPSKATGKIANPYDAEIGLELYNSLHK